MNFSYYWEEIAAVFNAFISTANNFLWGYLLVFVLFGTHLYFTIRLKFPQRHLGKAVRILLLNDHAKRGNLSSFRALSIAVAAMIGISSVVGMATAICIGGAGAVFWCFVAGALGIATRYAESLLAVVYQVYDKNGVPHGGPMFTLLRGMKSRVLAAIFAICTCLAVPGIGNLVQCNALAKSVEASYHVPPPLTGAIMVVLTALVLIGGLKRIADICVMLVPFMAVTFFCGCFYLLGTHWRFVGEACEIIVKSAFSTPAVVGGLAGSGVALAARYGIMRGLFSNEAGMGSEPIVAAAAITRNPAQQGLVSTIGTLSSVVICLCSGITMITCALGHDGEISLTDGVLMAQQCFDLIPYVGKHILTFSVCAFGFTTVIGWFYYGEQSVLFLCGKRGWQITCYKILYVSLCFAGTVWSLNSVWSFSDFANGLMVIPNVLSIWCLRKVIFRETQTYLFSGNLDEYSPRIRRWTLFRHHLPEKKQ